MIKQTLMFYDSQDKSMNGRISIDMNPCNKVDKHRRCRIQLV